MVEKWRGAGKIKTLEEANALSVFDIAKMNLKERAELAQMYYRQFNLRVNTFLKANVIPFALTKTLNTFEKIKEASELKGYDNFSLDSAPVVTQGRFRTLSPMFSDMENPNNALYHYIAIMQDFFRARSSTVTGWRNIGLEQDMRLFGAIVTPKKGSYNMTVKPKFTMTDDERRKFWSLYDLAREAGFENRFGYSSSQAQRELASMWSNGDFDISDIDASYNAVLKLLDIDIEDYKDVAPGDLLNPTHPVRGEDGLGGDNLV